jgi:hypothetical protein
MTKREKQVLFDVVMCCQNLSVTVAALESHLVHNGLLATDQLRTEEEKWVLPVCADLAALRRSISALVVTA